MQRRRQYSREIDCVLTRVDILEDHAGGGFLGLVFGFGRGGRVSLGERGALCHVLVKRQTLHATVAAANAVGRAIRAQPHAAVALRLVASNA